MARNLTSARMDEKAAEASALLEEKMTRIAATAASQLWDVKHVDKLTKRLADITDKIQKANLKGDKERADILQKRLDSMHLEIANPRDLKRLSKGAANAAQTFGEGLSGAFQTLKSKDLGQMAGMFKKMGQSVASAGTKMEANSMKGGILGGEGVAGLGKAMSAIGPAIAAIAGAAVGIAALVKIVMDADSRIKDLNKSMIEAGIAGQEFGDNVGRGMEHVRNAFTGLGATEYLNDLGTTSKETIGALGGLQKAGLTFQEITAGASSGADAVDKLRESVKGVIVYSKLLGESADKVASDMAKMAEETSTTLEGVRDNFSEIAAAAKQSGFDTKRFYGMVLEATTGMSMYNVRLQDTIGLLTKAGKVLGPDAGKAWAQSLAGTGTDLSTRDAYINQKKMGTGNVQAASKIDAELQADALRDSFKEIAAKGGQGAKQLEAALGKAGMTANMDPKEMAKTLGNLSEDQALVLRAELNRVEGVSGLGTKAAKAQYVARSGQGKGGEGGAVNALQNAGQFLGLASKLQGANAISKDLDMTTMGSESVVSRIAAEQVGGKMTNQDMDMLRDAIGALKSRGEKVNMENIGKELGLMQKMANEDGKKLEDEKKRKENAWKTDQEIASKIVDNTQSIADRMDNVIEQLLTSISEGIGQLVSWFLGGEGTKEGKSAAIEESQARVAKLGEKLSKLQGSGPEAKAARDLIKKEMAKEREMAKVIGKDTSTTGTSDAFRAAAQKSALTEDEKRELEQVRAEARRQGRQEKGYRVSGDGEELLEKRANEAEAKFLADRDKKADRGISGALSQAATADVDNAEKAAAALDKKNRDDQKPIDDKRTDEQTKQIKENQEKALKEQTEDLAIQADLVKAGMSSRQAAILAPQIRSGKESGYDPKTQAFVDKVGPVAHDGILTLDRGDGNPKMHRIDSSDSVVGIGKPGGPLSKGGGGHITISVNQWGDVPGAILKAMETMRVRT